MQFLIDIQDIDHLSRLIISLYFLKSVIIGSDFSFSYWIKYKKNYTKWYFNRETYYDYLKRADTKILNEIKNK